ncbi:hypothetical protein G9C98_002804 [Cotesia typhae]|uniref:Uncharacterized protein n=1 Tax=Cotesia typhae TaxID=2053667 RepID=A0A8J5RHL9_9HYME|nr:hypothetical protein G9C98_002804 [Cotesia typhae]
MEVIDTNNNEGSSAEDSEYSCICACILYNFVLITQCFLLLLKFLVESIYYILCGFATFFLGTAIYFFIFKKLLDPSQINYSVHLFRRKREIALNSSELQPAEIYNYNIYSAEVITLIVIVMIKYVLTGLIFWYSKKGNYKLILPYLMFLIVVINVLLIFFLFLTIQNFKHSKQVGFLVLAFGLFILGNGVYFWIAMYRRYQNLKDQEYLIPFI